jgi:hypothetical protein
MKTISKQIPRMPFFLGLLFFAAPFCLGDELIAPTRTLEGTKVNSGRISVLSEPPGLDVFLNNSKIGQTPIASMAVNAGVHKLRVQDSEKEILVTPGKSLQFSVYKGAFIEVQKGKEKTEKQQRSEVDKITKERKKGEATEVGKEYEPLYWPLNPRGPIQ